MLLLILILSGCTEAELMSVGRQVLQETSTAGNGLPLSESEIAAGLREALRVGSDRVVAQLGQTDGFNRDPQVHIPLPEDLNEVRRKLAKIGMASLFDDLELRLNRAAEAATPKAKELFWQAISDMSLDDARAILSGGSDAATRYFERSMSPGLTTAMRPLVAQTLEEVGAIKSFNKVMNTYRSIPFAPAVNADLTGYVVERGKNGIFRYLAKEEAAIRNDPGKRTTELLRRVFARQ
jgi:hypothetical protein